MGKTDDTKRSSNLSMIWQLMGCVVLAALLAGGATLLARLL